MEMESKGNLDILWGCSEVILVIGERDRSGVGKPTDGS